MDIVLVFLTLVSGFTVGFLYMDYRWRLREHIEYEQRHTEVREILEKVKEISNSSQRVLGELGDRVASIEFQVMGLKNSKNMPIR